MDININLIYLDNNLITNMVQLFKNNLQHKADYNYNNNLISLYPTFSYNNLKL